MIPDYIHDEIDRRLRAGKLHRSKAKGICRLLGIDLDQALDARPTIDDTAAELRELVKEEAADRGAVWFQFATGAEGSKRRVRGRIVFVKALDATDGNRDHVVSECQALVWPYGELAPSWQRFPEERLPLELLQTAYEEIGALTATKRRAGAFS